MSLSKFQTNSTSPQVLVVETFNGDEAVVEEKYEQTKWSNRSERMKKVLLKGEAQLIHLQEMRKLDGNKTPREWLSSFGEKYGFQLSNRNPTKYTFGVATIFDESKLIPCSEIITKWFSDTPNIPSDTWEDEKGQTGFGYNALFMKFAFVENEKVVMNCKPFWSVNVHFPMSGKLKIKCCHLLVAFIKEICGSDTAIITGDFNLPFSDDPDGELQLKVLEDNLINVSKMKITSQKKRPVKGTFIGYPHDKFCEKDPQNSQKCIDYIFLWNADGIEYEEETIAITETGYDEEPDELSDVYKLPSDHLGLKKRFVFRLSN